MASHLPLKIKSQFLSVPHRALCGLAAGCFSHLMTCCSPLPPPTPALHGSPLAPGNCQSHACSHPLCTLAPQPRTPPSSDPGSPLAHFSTSFNFQLKCHLGEASFSNHPSKLSTTAHIFSFHNTVFPSLCSTSFNA